MTPIIYDHNTRSVGVVVRQEAKPQKKVQTELRLNLCNWIDSDRKK